MKKLTIKFYSFLCSMFFTTSVFCQTPNMLPTIPLTATNPHLATAFDGVKTGSTTADVNAFKNSDECLIAAYAYLHPSSPHKNQQAYLDRLLFLLDIPLTNWKNNTNLDDIAFAFQASASYYMLKIHNPSKIPSAKKANWEQGIKNYIAANLAENPEVYNSQIVGAVWLNGEQRRALGCYFGALAISDNTNATKFKSVIENCFTQTLLNDGGTHYVGYQNESPSYHGEASIRFAIWYYILTKNTKVLNFIKATKNYIPLVFHQYGKGFTEYSSSPAWKPYYNQTTLKVEALAKAYLTGDKYNYEIGEGSQNLYLAFLYRAGLSTTTLPNNFVVYDKNTMGPRGRYGVWGTVGTTRDVASPAPELTETPYYNMDGIQSFVGAYVLDAGVSTTTYPLNSAFHGAAPAVKVETGVETDFQRGNKWAFLTGKNSKNTSTRSRNVYGLSTRYNVSLRRFAETGWDAEQQWIFTPDRVIGMVEIETSTATTSYGLAQWIKLCSGRLNASGIKKTISSTGTNQWSYGDLRVKIHGQDFSGAIKTFQYGTMNAPDDTYSTMIQLHEAKDLQNDAVISYPAGTRKYAIIEVTYDAKSYATNVAKLNLVTGLRGFDMQDAYRKTRVVHNVTGSAITYTGGTISCPFNKARVLKSWDESALNAFTVSGGNGTIPSISIPAYGHITVVISNVADDHVLGYYQYSNKFTAAPAAREAADGSEETETETEKLGMSIFPNPSSKNIINVQANLKEDGAVNITVLNMLGEQVILEDLGEKSKGILNVPLNVSKLKTGTFLIKMSHNEVIETVKFIKVE